MQSFWNGGTCNFRQSCGLPSDLPLRDDNETYELTLKSEAVFSLSNPLVGRLRILGFVVETDVCGARLGRRRTRLFLTTFLSHFRKRQYVTLLQRFLESEVVKRQGVLPET